MVFCEIFLIKGLSLISGEQIVLFIYLVALLMERLKNAMNKSLKNYSFTLFRIRVFFFFKDRIRIWSSIILYVLVPNTLYIVTVDKRIKNIRISTMLTKIYKFIY